MVKRPSYEELEKRVRTLEKASQEHRKTEEALRSSEGRLSQIIQSISIPIFVIDENHVVTHYNKALDELSGIPAAEIIGTRKQWRNFYAHARPTLADLIADNATEEGIASYYKDKYRKSSVIAGAYEVEDFFANLGDEGRWIYFTAAPLKDASGNITGAIETLQDITERKRAEEAHLNAERRYKTLLDFAPYPIVVFSLDGLVTYLNPAFTETFGWTLQELEGKTIPYVPPGLEEEAREGIKKLFEQKVIFRYETKRLTKDNRTLDVVMRASVFSETGEAPTGELVILRDLTREKRITRNNEAMLRITMGLPHYPELYELLDYVSGVIKDLIGSEGGVVTLYDEMRQDLFFKGAAYDDETTQRRVKEARFSLDELVAGQVIREGEPLIVNDTSHDNTLHKERDERLGYKTRNLLLVPLKSIDRVIGVLCAINKKEGPFDQTDVELLNMVAGTVALSIENARFAEEIKEAYREVSAMNRAKDKVINHLSHELKTPLAVLQAGLATLTKRLGSLPEATWKPTIERARRNVARLSEIQYQVDDIIQEKPYKAHYLLSHLLDQVADELEALVAEEVGEGVMVQKIRDRIEEIFGSRELVSERIRLHDFVLRRIHELKPLFSHREVEIRTRLWPAPEISIPKEVLQKTFDGLLRNAIENTPDEGQVEVIVQRKGEGAELIVHDHGVGITEENKPRIFEGFFTTRETLAYSRKSPFDFNAGGKGTDLLRIKIFSERYHFQTDMTSTRCRYIPKDGDICFGRISLCTFCKEAEDCHLLSGTVFSLSFKPAP